MRFTTTTRRGATACRTLLAGILVLTSSAALAHEGDHWPIAGGSLEMAWTANGAQNKFQFKTKKQININSISLAEDPTVERSTLTVRGSGDVPGTSGIIDLDPARWTPIGKPEDHRGWKFKGDAYYNLGITKIQLKTAKTDGSMQITAKGTEWPFEIKSAQDKIEIILTIGEFAFCAEYSAERQAEFKTNEAGEIQATLSLAPGECPQICGNSITEGTEECDDGNSEDGDTCTNGCIGCNPADADFDSTYEGIQQLIFDNPVYLCSNDACHGTATEGGLDLRAGNSYASLMGTGSGGVASQIQPSTVRVFPGDQDKSMLFKKVAAKVLGTSVDGSSMPSNSAVLTAEHLETIRKWIRGGAPETGVVDGTAELLDSCLPPPTPLDIPQPPIPDSSVGTQFAMPGYNLRSEDETEGCVASYYDVSSTVPAGMVVDCPQDPENPGHFMFEGTNGTGPLANKCFTYRGNELYQDAQSHHSIVHIYPGQYNWNDPGWGNWRCYGGPTPNSSCSPTNPNSCGEGGVCGGIFHTGVACLDFVGAQWGAPDFDTSTSPQFSGSQETTADFNLPVGVYGMLPVRGLIVWNSHAFNLTNQDTQMESWINIEYTEDRVWPAQGLFDSRWIFTQNVPPFEKREYCATHTFAEGTRLFQLTSHTHKRGVRWRYYAAPQTPCGNGSGGNVDPLCLPGSINDLFYESYDYSDATTLRPDPPIHYTGTVADRTIKFCSVFDNGFANPATVKKQSTSPSGLVGGPCSDALVRCMGGPNYNQLCHGNNTECPESTCDACPLRGGVTTEDEMFIPLGTFYIDP